MAAAVEKLGGGRRSLKHGWQRQLRSWGGQEELEARVAAAKEEEAHQLHGAGAGAGAAREAGARAGAAPRS